MRRASVFAGASGYFLQYSTTTLDLRNESFMKEYYATGKRSQDLCPDPVDRKAEYGQWRFGGVAKHAGLQPPVGCTQHCGVTIEIIPLDSFIFDVWVFLSFTLIAPNVHLNC